MPSPRASRLLTLTDLIEALILLLYGHSSNDSINISHPDTWPAGRRIDQILTGGSLQTDHSERANMGEIALSNGRNNARPSTVRL